LGGKEEGISNVEEKELCGEEEITVCARFSSLLRPELLLFFGIGDVVVGPRLQSLRLSLTRDEAGEKLLLL
jgi:hypothetical protein